MTNNGNVIACEGASTLQEILLRLLQSLQYDFQIICVRREMVLSDCLKAMKRSFDIKKKFKVEFVGEDGQDDGALVRELWRLLKEELHFESAFFIGCTEVKVPLHNTSALEGGRFKLIGELMALSFLQGGTGFPFLAPCIYDFICGLPIASLQPSVDHIPDPQEREIALQISEATMESLPQLLARTDVSDVVYTSGFTQDVKPERRRQILRAILLQQCIFSLYVQRLKNS